MHHFILPKLKYGKSSLTFKNKNLEVFLSFCAFRKGYEAAVKGFDAQDLDVSVVGRSERSAELCSRLCRSEIMEPPAHVCFQVGLSTWCVGTKREQRRPGRLLSTRLGTQ